jgi:hypothetical protein
MNFPMADSAAERIERIEGALREQAHTLKLLADASADIVDEAMRAREARASHGQENRGAHNRTATAIGALESSSQQTTYAVNALRTEVAVAAAATGATVDALKATIGTLTNLLIGGATAGTAAILGLTFSLLWLYADKNGQDADAALQAGTNAAKQLVPGSQGTDTLVPVDHAGSAPAGGRDGK